MFIFYWIGLRLFIPQSTNETSVNKGGGDGEESELKFLTIGKSTGFIAEIAALFVGHDIRLKCLLCLFSVYKDVRCCST